MDILFHLDSRINKAFTLLFVAFSIAYDLKICGIAPVIALCCLYILLFIISSRRAGKAFALIFWIMFFLNGIDLLVTAVVASWSSPGIFEFELNPFLRFFSTEKFYIGMGTMFLLKTVVSLVCVDPLLILQKVILKKKYQYTLLSKTEMQNILKDYHAYIRSCEKTQVTFWLKGKRVPFVFEDRYINYLATESIQNIANILIVVSFTLIAVDIHNIIFAIWGFRWLTPGLSIFLVIAFLVYIIWGRGKIINIIDKKIKASSVKSVIENN